MLSNGFTFRFCNLHNLAFRGLDLAYMPKPPGFANRDCPHARATRTAFLPPARLLHVWAPQRFAAEDQDRARFRTGEVQNGVRFMTDEDQTTRRGNLDGATMAE